jgi:LPS export ABC transporter protein LptC
MVLQRNAYKYAALFLMFFALCFGAFILVQERERVAPALFHPVRSEHVLMSMKGFRIARSERGAVSWIMNARDADLLDNKKSRLNEVDIHYFAGSSGAEATLTSDAGQVDTMSGDATFFRGSHDVKVVSSDGYLLTTAHALLWNADSRKIETTGQFTLLGKELYLEGVGMTADVDLRFLTVRNNVKAVLQE